MKQEGQVEGCSRHVSEILITEGLEPILHQMESGSCDRRAVLHPDQSKLNIVSFFVLIAVLQTDYVPPVTYCVRVCEYVSVLG